MKLIDILDAIEDRELEGIAIPDDLTSCLEGKVDAYSAVKNQLEAQIGILKSYEAKYALARRQREGELSKLKERIKWAMQAKGWLSLKGEKSKLLLVSQERIKILRDPTAEDLDLFGMNMVKAEVITDYTWVPGVLEHRVKAGEDLGDIAKYERSSYVKFS